MLNNYKTLRFLFLIFIFIYFYSCKKSNEKVINNGKTKIYKFNQLKNGLISCNTTENSILIMDSLGNRKKIIPEKYNSKLCYLPFFINDSSIIYQEDDSKNKSIVKYNFKENKTICKLSINDKIKSHVKVNDSIIVLGFNSGEYKKLNSKTIKLEKIYDFSEYKYFQQLNEPLQTSQNNILILNPDLGNKSIIKISLTSKKVLWRTYLNFNFINFITTEKFIFYIATNDFGKGELGIINISTGKIIFQKNAFPNVLVLPKLINKDIVYFADTRGKINLFSLSSFNEKVIYISENESAFLGIGSSQLYFSNNYIYRYRHLDHPY